MGIRGRRFRGYKRCWPQSHRQICFRITGTIRTQSHRHRILNQRWQVRDSAWLPTSGTTGQEMEVLYTVDLGTSTITRSTKLFIFRGWQCKCKHPNFRHVGTRRSIGTALTDMIKKFESIYTTNLGKCILHVSRNFQRFWCILLTKQSDFGVVEVGLSHEQLLLRAIAVVGRRRQWNLAAADEALTATLVKLELDIIYSLHYTIIVVIII